MTVMDIKRNGILGNAMPGTLLAISFAGNQHANFLVGHLLCPTNSVGLLHASIVWFSDYCRALGHRVGCCRRHKRSVLSASIIQSS